MTASETCPTCGKPRTARTGRGAVYCSAACRQKAYRERRTAGPGVQDLIDDIGRRARALTPHPPATLYTGVAELSASVARLRRIARTAHDTSDPDPAPAPAPPMSAVREDREHALGDSVTPTAVTEFTEADFAALAEAHRREIQVLMTRRHPTLADVAATAVFLASDHAAGITGTFVNVTGGMVPR
jgi:hypothetical protein